MFLDEEGHDRLMMGEETDPQLPGPVIVKRIAQGYGVTIHDEKGNERGGFGWIATGRAIISLDRPDQDAWSAYVDDKTGFAGTVTMFAPAIAGRNATGLLMGTRGKSSFIYLKDTHDDSRAILQVDGVTPPSLKVFQTPSGPPKEMIDFNPQH